MTSPNREIEIKFEVMDLDQLDRLRQQPMLADRFVLAPVQEQAVVDTYLDTSDYALLRAGFSLRLRRLGTRQLATVKALASAAGHKVQDRYELERELDQADELAIWPADIADQIARIAGKEARLQPIAVLHQTRHKRTVAPQPTPQGDGAGPPAAHVENPPMGELSIDMVTVHIPDSQEGEVSERVMDFAEIEFELARGGERAILKGMGRALARSFRLQPLHSNKLERALRQISMHPPGYPATATGIQPHMHMAEAARTIWHTQLMAMLLCEAGARQGKDPEYVHDMRVAIRRARAAARLCASYFKKKAIKRHLKALQRTARVLGAVRDLDVALENLAKYGKKRPAPERKELNAAARVWKRQRKTAHKELLAWLDSARYGQFVADFSDFCRTPGLGIQEFTWMAGTSPPPHQVRHVLPSTMMTQFEAMRAYEVVFESGVPVPDETLHALRIEGKQLRYSLEFTVHLLGEPGEALVSQLKQIQNQLGDLHDASVTKGHLQTLREQGVDNAALQNYGRHQDEIIESLRHSFPETWQAFVGPENRELLARTVAQL